MKNLAVMMLLLLALISSTRDSASQTRDRRVGQTTSSPAPPPATSTQTTPSGATTGREASASSPEVAPNEIGENEVVRVNTTLVTVPVSVTDRDGRYVADLGKEDFRIFEDGVEQTVAYFAALEKPFTVVLMLDTSASTWSKLGQIKDAAQAFVEQLRLEDQVMLVTFARGVTIKCEPTTDRRKIRKAIAGTGRGLSTHLYDAMDKVMSKRLNRIPGRKAIVLFTDGVDATSNDATYESTVRVAEELDALIYPILYDTYDPQSETGNPPAPASNSRLPSILKRIPLPLPIPTQGGGGGGGGGTGSSRADYDRGERYLRELAELTGGRVYAAGRDLSRLRDAFGNIAEELRRQYSLGYYPNTGGAIGGRRQIRVRVGRPHVAVRARGSYVSDPTAAAPGDAAITAEDGGRQPTAPVLRKKPFADVQDRK